MRLIWTALAMASLVVACHDNNKPADDPTTSGAVGPMANTQTTTPTSGTQSTTTATNYNSSTTSDPSLRNDSTPNLNGPTNPEAYGYGANNAGPAPQNFGGNPSNAGTTSASGGMGAGSMTDTTTPSEADRKLSTDVQVELAKLSGLSSSAKQVDVSALGGRVTLKGDVRSPMEHDKIVRAAKKVAGETQVDDRLTVKR